MSQTRAELLAENRRWIQNELERRRQAKRAAAAHARPVDGFSPVSLPSLADGLDEIQDAATRYAGGTT